jgi:hypothetical protein
MHCPRGSWCRCSCWVVVGGGCLLDVVLDQEAVRGQCVVVFVPTIELVGSVPVDVVRVDAIFYQHWYPTEGCKGQPCRGLVEELMRKRVARALHYASKSLGKVQLKKVPATNKSRSAKINQEINHNLPNQNWFPTLQNGRSANESSFRRLLPYLKIQTSNTVSNSVAKAPITPKKL